MAPIIRVRPQNESCVIQCTPNVYPQLRLKSHGTHANSLSKETKTNPLYKLAITKGKQSFAHLVFKPTCDKPNRCKLLLIKYLLPRKILIRLSLLGEKVCLVYLKFKIKEQVHGNKEPKGTEQITAINHIMGGPSDHHWGPLYELINILCYGSSMLVFFFFFFQ